MEQQHGLLIVNKPRGLSSAQCTNRFKRLGQKKLGHAGTLDPMAQGVLIVLLGQATKLFGYLLSEGRKTYQGTIRFGQTTDTWDAEGTILSEMPWGAVQAEAVRREVAGWCGVKDQLIPPYSAAKHQGQPLYRLSRAGKDAPVKTKTIAVSHAEVLRVELPYVTFRVTCSSGTYIRSLAHSLGMRFGCGAVLTELTREYSYPFGLEEAYPLDTLLAEPERLPERIRPITAALPHWPEITLSAAEIAAVKNGRSLVWGPSRPTQDALGRAVVCATGNNAVLALPDGTPLALARAEGSSGQIPPVWKVIRGLW